MKMWFNKITRAACQTVCLMGGIALGNPRLDAVQMVKEGPSEKSEVSAPLKKVGVIRFKNRLAVDEEGRPLTAKIVNPGYEIEYREGRPVREIMSGPTGKKTRETEYLEGQVVLVRSFRLDGSEGGKLTYRLNPTTQRNEPWEGRTETYYPSGLLNAEREFRDGRLLVDIQYHLNGRKSFQRIVQVGGKERVMYWDEQGRECDPPKFRCGNER